MSLTYPLLLPDFQDQLPIAQMAFYLRKSESISTTGDGAILSEEIGTPAWRCKIKLGPMAPAETSFVEVLLDAVTGPGRFFRLSPLQRVAPLYDPDGAVLGANLPAVNAVDHGLSTVDIAGLPAGYVLNRGDIFSMNFNTPKRYTLHRIADLIATADGSGQMSGVQVEPNVPLSFTGTPQIRLLRPFTFFKLVPGSISPGTFNGWVTTDMAFEAVQTLML